MVDLVKSSKKQQSVLEQVDKVKVAADLLSKNLTSIDEIAVKYGLTLEQAKRLVSESEFLEDIQRVQKGAARVEFFNTVYDKLITFIRVEQKPRVVIQAIRILAPLLGEIDRSTSKVNIQNNVMGFDAMIRQLTAEGPQRDEHGELDGSWPGGAHLQEKEQD